MLVGDIRVFSKSLKTFRSVAGFRPLMAFWMVVILIDFAAELVLALQLGPFFARFFSSPLTSISIAASLGVLIPILVRGTFHHISDYLREKFHLRFQTEIQTVIISNLMQTPTRTFQREPRKKWLENPLFLLVEQTDEACVAIEHFIQFIFSILITLSFVGLLWFWSGPVAAGLLFLLTAGAALAPLAHKKIKALSDRFLKVSQRHLRAMEIQLNHREFIQANRLQSKLFSHLSLLAQDKVHSGSLRIGIQQTIPLIIEFATVLTVFFCLFSDSKNINPEIGVASLYVAFRVLSRIPALMTSWTVLRVMSPSLEAMSQALTPPDPSLNESKVHSAETDFLQISGIKHWLGEAQSQQGFQFNISQLLIPKSGLVAVLGPNGSGKTSLLRLLAGTLIPDAGTVTFPFADKVTSSTYWSSQEAVLLDEPSMISEIKDLSKKPQHQELKKSLNLELIIHGLEESSHSSMDHHSVGERKRLELFWGLSRKPSLILLDEALDSLDLQIKIKFLKYLRNQKELLLIFSTHDLALAEQADLKVQMPQV